ncbi:unnamed protein product [Cuscuta epithymum]|uniref:Protein kinase domain-containing protein n=1 Tax=Cuscuta epithymum TaxID=186058 RepID=A0AAV0DF39_9ASTE|nr:unnamed protein product [Cuscuta epithymum]
MMDSKEAASSQIGIGNDKELIVHEWEIAFPSAFSPSVTSMSWYAYLKYAISIFNIRAVSSDENVTVPSLKFNDQYLTSFEDLERSFPVANVHDDSLIRRCITDVENAVLWTLYYFYLEDLNHVPQMNDFKQLTQHLSEPIASHNSAIAEKMPKILSQAEAAFQRLALRLSDSSYLFQDQENSPSVYDAKLVASTSIILKTLADSQLHRVFLKYSNIVGHVERFYSLLVDDAPVDFSNVISDILLEKIEVMGDLVGEGQYARIYAYTVEEEDPMRLPPGRYAFKINRRGYYINVKGEIDFRTWYRFLYGDRVLRLIGHGSDDVSKRACLVTEYITGGTLQQRLHDLGLRSIVKVLHGIAFGLHLIHSHIPDSLIHGDLKPDNVLLKGDKALLCDFGTITSVGERRKRSDPVYDDSYWGGIDCTKVEIYFIGVLVFEMMTKIPVERIKNDPLIDRVNRLIPDSNTCEDQIQEYLLVQPEYNRYLVAQLIDLGKKCICKNRGERPAAFQVADELHRLMISDY